MKLHPEDIFAGCFSALVLIGCLIGLCFFGYEFILYVRRTW